MCKGHNFCEKKNINFDNAAASIFERGESFIGFWSSKKGKAAGLEVIFLELSNKMSNDIVLTISHDRALFSGFFHQNIFPVV